MIKKIVISVLLVAMIATAGISVGVKYSNERKAKRELAYISAQITQLKAESASLQIDIENAWDQYHEATSDDISTLVLFYDNMEPNLMEEIYPVLSKDQYGYKGTVIFSDLRTPGAAGCITMDDYRTLKNNGWDFALGTGTLDLSGENSVEILRAYLENYKTILDETGIAMPVTFCFNKGQYDEKYDEVLHEYGVGMIRHFGETGELFSGSAVQGQIYRLGSGILCSAPTTMKADITEADEKALAFSASVRYVMRDVLDEELDCTYSKYTQMLDFIKDMNVMTASEFYEYKVKTLLDAAKFVETFNKNLAVMEERLVEIEDEVKVLEEKLANLNL